ncbi:hypothetical protein Ddye_019448 [Dipteronia dyeriana]|uniref:Receptor-like serine/threonine-protein kinase n=1 Tax=Dipteronia dyeriana TaxID=168575 RepID=A0AAD9WVM6_9ROSI|nr:hypothetical protein Ddye_019448 [Dipteronia dyeriana]
MELSSGRVSGALIVFLLCCFCSDFGSAIDTITASRPIRDHETIISNSSIFRFGFFSPGSSSNRYVGIWYNDDNKSAETVIWVANRNNPLNDSSGVITISEDGNLVVLNGQNNAVVWSSNVSNPLTNVGSARLLDSGNLVLLPRNSNGSIWESFQEPTDTFMSKMKLEKMLQLSSWKYPFDPSIGSFSAGIGPSNIPEVFIWNNNRPYWRSGPWNGKAFIGVFDGFDIVVDNQERAAAYNLSFKFPNNLLSYIVLDSLGKLLQVNRVSGKEDLEVGSSYPATECDKYDRCGGFGSCYAKEKVFCSCLRGFVPKNVEEWNRGYSASGCVRRRLLQCERISRNGEVGKADGFLKLGMLKVPDFAERSSVPEVKCREQCLNNCSCIAYAYDAGIGYKKDMKVVVIVSVVVGVVAIAICTFFLWWWMAKRKAMKEKSNMPQLQDLPVFNFEKLAIATNNFNLTNKLGQGGFGPVYKGVLQDGQEIAVKRLSKASGQGLEEFMNEVMVISKLQHRNLVRLLGCCVEREEKMLIYEYMPNKSLDAFIFDPLKQELLDWSKRFNIIEGISRGLMYLHRDSRLRIIHRDLKSSNILLNEELNPKISDFGMARIFGGNQDQANTRRVVGTYGYISPEYAMGGQFSEKSDVFSFGVLLLEIVSGKRNTGFYQDENSPTLLGYAWKLWNENNISALIDPVISDPPSFQSEILRCIQVGLLCVQEFVKDRPTMPTVVSMLNSEIVDLPTPKQPAFTERQNTFDSESSKQLRKSCSVNYVTVTATDVR